MDMGYFDRTMARVLLFIAMAMFLIALNLAEQLYPGYKRIHELYQRSWKYMQRFLLPNHATFRHDL